MSIVLVDSLNVRETPSTSLEPLAQYKAFQTIKSGDELIENEGRLWLKYTGKSGYERYVCVEDIDGSIYVDVNFDSTNYGTGIGGFPKQKQFPVGIIKSGGCCFLCTCVKGGLTTIAECMLCFYWGINTGRIDVNNNCYVSYPKEIWAKEISQKFKTPYHGDYQFQNNGRHFWLARNGREIFNSAGLGYR